MDRMVALLVSARSRLCSFWLVLLLLGSGAGTGLAASGQTWVMRNGEEYFGAATHYDFQSRQLSIIKADGKTYSFAARDLAFSGKLQLIDSPAFGTALQNYQPPFLPTATVALCVGLALCLPAMTGLWASAHLFGVASSVGGHVGGFLKLLAIVIGQGIVWLIAAVYFDAGKPLLPDTNADIVMTLTVLVVGLLAASLVVALHYHRSFWKGMAITCLAGVFGSIVATALGLTSLYLATRMDYETLVTRVVFEPFAVF